MGASAVSAHVSTAAYWVAMACIGASVLYVFLLLLNPVSLFFTLQHYLRPL
jgi:hypothetical protein